MSKETLKTLILDKFPDNEVGEISPQDLRDVQNAIVDEVALVSDMTNIDSRVTDLETVITELDSISASTEIKEVPKIKL